MYKKFLYIVKLTTITIMLSIVVVEILHLEKVDVKTKILHVDLEEDVYM